MYKALITDLDGTAVPLTSDGSDVDDATRATIKEAQAKGYHIACATGRAWFSAKPVVVALGIQSLCVINGGSAIINPKTEEIVWEKPLDHGTTHLILDIFKRFGPDGLLYSPLNNEEVPLKDTNELPESLRYMYLLAIPVSASESIAVAINKTDFAVAHQTPSWHGKGLMDVHITHPDATKEHGIKMWHKLQNVSVEETIGMGDSGNDVPIFRAAGLKVATGNATNELKALADYISPNVDDHSLKHVIDKYLLKQ